MKQIVMGVALLAGAAFVAPALGAPGNAQRWPSAQHGPAPTGADEARIRAIVAGMTLEQKIGQITQPNIDAITPDEVRQYYIGSILNGGGAWPNKKRNSTIKDWLDLSERYYRASMSTDMKVKVPVLWGTDAVHGHNNIVGATLYPHNIGLGAAHDPGLITRIGRATARDVRATGISWAFAPTLAVVQNPRWGRTYESYSSDPELVRAYGEAMVRGLQGDLRGSGDVLATAKHYLGDGGTTNGVNEGVTRATEMELIRTHSPGYYGALKAGVQTVMVSYSSWTDARDGKAWGKMHGNRYLVTDVLKKRLGFDGLVVSDWNGIQQIPGCTRWHCPEAVNAGIDLFMVPDDWKAFIKETTADVRAGRIPMARIDDAVTRILRVKMRAGLFAASPASGPHPKADVIGDAASRQLAREAVAKSLVLLKNNNRALPLARGSKILVVGAGANTVSAQTGGWSVTWQGDETTNQDFPGAVTILGALNRALGLGHVDYSADGSKVDLKKYRAVVFVAAEKPYAETKGDLVYPTTMRHTARYPSDLAALDRVAGKGVPVVTVLLSGRPVYANDLINKSDAFVAAWLPGTEGLGVSDVLVAGGRDFTGRLSFDWPGQECLTPNSVQFRRGYGLSYRKAAPMGALPLGKNVATCPASSR